MEGREAADPVVGGQRGRTHGLVHVHGIVGAQNGEVDGLLVFVREAFQDGAGLVDQAQPARDGTGQAQDAEAELVFSAVAVLPHDLPGDQRAEQPGDGGFVHAHFLGDLADARVPVPGEDFHDLQGPVHGLHAPALRVRIPVGP